MVTITVDSGSVCSINKNDAPFIRKAISYKSEIMITVKHKGFLKKQRKVVLKTAWAGKTENLYFFWRGNLRSVLTHLKKTNKKFKLIGINKTLPTNPPQLKNITLRPYQEELVVKAIQNKRGVIHAATASGKSAIISGIMSAYHPAKCLVLAHLIDLIQQLKENFETHLGEDVTILTSKQPTANTRISITTIQTLSKMAPENYEDVYDIIIIDEAHMVSKYDGNYAKVLSTIQTPFRFGFTATLPPKPSAAMALQSFIGIVIGKLSINKAAIMDILAKPKIILIKAEKNVEHSNITSYKEAVQENIIKNTCKNKLIIDCVQKLNSKGLTVLVLVSLIEHGNWLQDKAQSMGMKIPFVYQDTDKETRLKTKQQLNNKKIKAVIASNIWKIGIDIPSLGAIIIAGGGKSQVQLIQSIGRGLRKIEGKENVVIVDIYDPSCKWMAEHFSERLCLYFENNWVGHTIEAL